MKQSLARHENSVVEGQLVLVHWHLAVVHDCLSSSEANAKFERRVGGLNEIRSFEFGIGHGEGERHARFRSVLRSAGPMDDPVGETQQVARRAGSRKDVLPRQWIGENDIESIPAAVVTFVVVFRHEVEARGRRRGRRNGNPNGHVFGSIIVGRVAKTVNCCHWFVAVRANEAGWAGGVHVETVAIAAWW